MQSALLSAIDDLVDQLEIAVDGDELTAVFRLREKLLAKSIRPLRDFDAAKLYRLSHAGATGAFLERTVGIAPAEAGGIAKMARRLGAMPETETAFADGTLSSGQVRAVIANVAPRVADRYIANEPQLVNAIAALTVRDTTRAMQSWAILADADADDKADKPPREDEFFHSQTFGGRFVTNGSFASVTGAVIATALRVVETDNRRDGDRRAPAERRAEALADICAFYLDYRNRTDNDPDAPTLPKKRSYPHLVGVVTTSELESGAGGVILDGPAIEQTSVEALSCTAQLLRLVLDESGAIRDYQLMPTTVTDALFGALAARDQGCRWPGCHKKPVHCDVHDIKHEQHGGETRPCNCCLLCKYHHHRGAHDTSITLHLAPDATLTITYADGTTETTKPPILQPKLPYAM